MSSLDYIKQHIWFKRVSLGNRLLTQEVVQTRMPYGAYLTTLTIKI